MTPFVDAKDPLAIEHVLQRAVSAMGLQGTLEQLAGVPGLPMRLGRPGAFLRKAEPTSLVVGDRALSVTEQGEASLQHVVGGVVLSRQAVIPRDLPAMLAAMVSRAAEEGGFHDQLAVTLTAMQDALA